LHLEGWILPVHLAIGLAFTVIEKGYRVRFYTLNELAAQLHNARIHNYEVKFIASVKRFVSVRGRRTSKQGNKE
jgi:hypothetical protein